MALQFACFSDTALLMHLTMLIPELQDSKPGADVAIVCAGVSSASAGLSQMGVKCCAQPPITSG